MGVMSAVETREADGGGTRDGLAGQNEPTTKDVNPTYRNRYGEVFSTTLPGLGGGDDQIRRISTFNTAPSCFFGSSEAANNVDDSEATRLVKEQKERVRFRVTAKLSKEGDLHLPRERANYESFPGHWYERWTGLNLVPPLHDPVPCGPVVPQYYGYYVPGSSGDGGVGETMGEDYLSPIMLLEDCGKQVVIKELNKADRCGFSLASCAAAHQAPRSPRSS